jgi:3-dehydroquinate synthase II
VKFFWVEAAENTWEERKKIITAALESGAKGVVVNPHDVENTSKLGDINIVVDDDGNPEELVNKGADIILVGKGGEGDSPTPPDVKKSKDLRRIRELKKAGFTACGYVEIKSKAHERLAAAEAREADFIVVVGEDWKVIPLENLIAELQKEECKVIAGVEDSSEAKLALETLEVGADGVLLRRGDINEIKRISELVARTSEKLTLEPAKIKTLKPVSMGDRVCIDTASLLRVGEGMLIGSQANGLFLIHSESLETEYVAARPFRVNAGAVHAYVLVPGGKTKYLSELKAGDEVLAVDREGNTRSVVVGRVKIERRPLMLVEAEIAGKTYKTLVQNAETIMLVDKKGAPVSVSKLKEGDEVLIHRKEKARHFGMEVEESIIET